MMEHIHLKRRLNKVISKISSQEGASITYALLLFLVCATVSSVILAAGTAASGRMSKSVDSDQRYYAVTSAARLLKEVVEQYEVKIIKTSNDSGSWDEEKKYRDKHAKGDFTNYDPFIVKVITMDPAVSYANKYFKIEEPDDSETKKEFTISFTISADSLDVEGLEKLDVSVKENIDVRTGRITFKVISKYGLESGKTSSEEDGLSYSMNMVFVPEIKTSDIIKKLDGTPEKTVTTKKIQMSWSLESLG